MLAAGRSPCSHLSEQELIYVLQMNDDMKTDWDNQLLFRDKHQRLSLYIPHTRENNGFSNVQASHSNANVWRRKKRQRMRWKDKRTWTWLQNAHLQVFNQNHMWLHMPSYAAVMAWPFNSVTNLLFLWKPQTINHSVQSGGLSWKFNTSSLSNDCTYVGVWDTLLLGAIFWSTGFIGTAGVVTNFTEFRRSSWELNKRRFTSGLWWHDRRRRESFCQHSQQGGDYVCFSYSSPSFCLCHQCLPALNPGSTNKFGSKEKF